MTRARPPVPAIRGRSRGRSGDALPPEPGADRTPGRSRVREPRRPPRPALASRAARPATPSSPAALRTPPRRDQQGRASAPPIKPPTWKWYIPIYFWSGGIAGGAWATATVADIAAPGHRALVRAGRYAAASGAIVGTALLVADLGRPERFLNMLRIVRPRSTMSLGSWALAAFGACTGAAALLQAAEDGLLGSRPTLARASGGRTGRALHVAALPLALFVGSYTGTLLATTSIPAWSRRAALLGPLFAASAASSGLAATTAGADLLARRGRHGRSARRARGHRHHRDDGEREPRDRVRAGFARAECVALAVELALGILARRRVRALPSVRAAPARASLAYALTLGAGITAPLALQLARARASDAHGDIDDDDAHGEPGDARIGDPSIGDTLERTSAALTLAGSLALRILLTREGYRSARMPNDTWAATGGTVEPEPPRVRRVPAEMHIDGLIGGTGRHAGRDAPARARRGEVVGRITIVQDDRVRVTDDLGRGYLLTLLPRRATAAELEAWRDAGTPVRIRYVGIPDLGARIERIAPVMR